MAKSAYSSMVRLEEYSSHKASNAFTISILVWYDWKKVVGLLVIAAKLISIPVWYDWKTGSLVSYSTSCLFQFQYGTIGSIFWNFRYKALPYFNSSMVRLEDFSFIIVWVNQTNFQFQYGTIGSRMPVIFKVRPTNFQFQYGTIGSLK